jgi:carbon storage regulator CsrA
MLVLGRKIDESIFIYVPGVDQRIEVKVTDIRRQEADGQLMAKIGIEAPKSFLILREELHKHVR